MGSRRTYAGEYTNASYGYSVMIPHGLTGAEVDNPAYQKGFTIVLRNPERTISVYADTNSLGYAEGEEAAAGELALFKQLGLHIDSEQILATEVGARPAASLSFRYRCAGRDSVYAHTEVVALSNDGQYVYTIAWDGPANQEKSDQELVAALRRSWRFLPAK